MALRNLLGDLALDATSQAILQELSQQQKDGLTDSQLRATPLPVTSEALTNAQLRSADVNTADSGEREYTHVVATVSGVGDNVVHTPQAGKRIVLRWIYAINEPTSSTSPLISVKLGDQEKYRVYALSKRQKVTGPVNGALIINLNASSPVAVTALIEEID